MCFSYDRTGYMIYRPPGSSIFFFFNDTATTEIYTLSLHDALPISLDLLAESDFIAVCAMWTPETTSRSEEHTSELQSLAYLVCRLLLEKKKNVRSTPARLSPPTCLMREMTYAMSYAVTSRCEMVSS